MTTLRVLHLAGYGLEVPDLAAGAAFYGAFGLQSDTQTQSVSLRTHSAVGTPLPAEIVLVPGAVKRLHHLSFAVRPQDLQPFAAHLQAMGCSPQSPAWASLRAGLWVQDPWGTWINLTPVDPSAQLVSNTPPRVGSGPRVDRHLWQELNRHIQPHRLGHMLIFTPDWEKAEAWFVQALGLRMSDRAAGKVTFMAGGTGIRDHHCFGLIKGTHRGFQHASFHVDTLDDIGLGAVQMHKAGYTQGFGVGRHALASNLFYYVRDPWGSWVEYYADMDKISENWQPRDWNELPYIWPAWAPEFWGQEMNANLEPR